MAHCGTIAIGITAAAQNDMRHLSLRTWWELIQNEMEAYFGKPTKALKCKPPAACLDQALLVLVEELLLPSIRDLRQKRRAMCALLIFKLSPARFSAVRYVQKHQAILPHPPSFSYFSWDTLWCQIGGQFECGCSELALILGLEGICKAK